MTRGLDVDDIKFVINYDYPSNSEDYIHRIGRTGRKGNTGTSYTLFTPQNSHKAQVGLVISVISSHLSSDISGFDLSADRSQAKSQPAAPGAR